MDIAGKQSGECVIKIEKDIARTWYGEMKNL
jgi:hypothetical protein